MTVTRQLVRLVLSFHLYTVLRIELRSPSLPGENFTCLASPIPSLEETPPLLCHSRGLTDSPVLIWPLALNGRGSEASLSSWLSAIPAASQKSPLHCLCRTQKGWGLLSLLCRLERGIGAAEGRRLALFQAKCVLLCPCIPVRRAG